MEYAGHTETASYTIGNRYFGGGRDTLNGTGESFFPALDRLPSSYKTHRSYPAPPIMRRANTMSWKGEDDDDISLRGGSAYGDRNRLGDLDTIKVPESFAAVRNTIGTRYTPVDWRKSNCNNLCASDRVRSGAELMRLDASRLCREMDDKTRKNQGESSKKLDDRIVDTDYWKGEVQAELDAMIAENADLEKMSGCVEKAMLETEIPLNIARQCLLEREKRIGIDLVHDEVEKQLLKEVDIISEIQNELRQHVNDARNQAALNRTARHELELDAADKFTAIGLDARSRGLRNASGGLQHYDNIESFDNTMTDPETWIRRTNDKILRSQNLRAASKSVRDSIQLLLMRAAESLLNQWRIVNAAFSDRIKEYMEAKDKLEAHLSKVLQETYDAEKTLVLLKKCLHDKDAPLKVAQTRLNTRTARPGIENCRDNARTRLINEIVEIGESADSLKAKIFEAQNAVDQLIRTRLAIEEDLAIKNNSLFIDREKCMGLRKSFIPKPRLYTVVTYN